MDDYQRYYVYVHKEPRARFGLPVMYVGMGQRDRAWHCRDTQRFNPEHMEWLEELFQDEYTMGDIVHIEAKGLSKEDAAVIEKELIAELNPKFNRPMGVPKKLSEEEINKAWMDRQNTGMSYSELAQGYGVSAMTVWRALNG
jgi:Mor family transcriptional regulator